MLIEGLVDSRNSLLWNELNSTCSISIESTELDEYAISSKDNNSIIYVSKNNINSSSFTHELLHLLLRKKGVNIGTLLSLLVRNKRFLSNIFSEGLIDHIGNCLCHVKMLPPFLEMGYKKEDFISDYGINKLTESDLLEIKALLLDNSTSGINFFIGKFFAAKACPNNDFDYSSNLKLMQEMDTELYCILDDFFLAWNQYDYTDENPITGGYREFLSDFIAQLEDWSQNKTINF